MVRTTAELRCLPACLPASRWLFIALSSRRDGIARLTAPTDPPPTAHLAGLMQASFYFGYMLMVCYAFFLMLGSVGFRASLAFVRHIYKAIKCE